jgi:hypothetical protein
MTERERLEQAIAALEAKRAILGDSTVDVALASLRKMLAARERSVTKEAVEADAVQVDLP